MKARRMVLARWSFLLPGKCLHVCISLLFRCMSLCIFKGWDAEADDCCAQVAAACLCEKGLGEGGV